MSSGLRILNGRYIGDSLGYFTYFSPNGCSVVDYGITSKGLLSSVKYFCTKKYKLLVRSCSDIFCFKMSENNAYKSNKKDILIPNRKSYKWTEQSAEKITQVCQSHDILSSVVDFELKEFEKSELDINIACQSLTSILDDISNKVCTVKKPFYKKKKKKIKNPWSDSEIRNLKTRINYLGKELKLKPFDTTLRHNYFTAAKELKKGCKTKKT